MAELREVIITPDTMREQHARITVTVKVRYNWRVTVGLWLIKAGAWLAGVSHEEEDE